MNTANVHKWLSDNEYLVTVDIDGQCIVSDPQDDEGGFYLVCESEDAAMAECSRYFEIPA